MAADTPEVVMAVEAERRGQGVGKRLLTALLDVARAQGHRALSLHVSNENTAASGLYESMGFRRVGEDEGRGAVMLRQLRL
ncbi:ribosomal protein S18 acetylase RimI-like enzyme [Friedmanniella endophytica]|uniref:Ribosomal protein S18 acetylase RimI-like enzyme n=1 Tax=Microlunatus kandeliicorticis TaxID=1759536 RepID=A0A7W3P5K4_9ACTN|nr:ribosomal protein S18 acetylase RimI-like enzyme [Microlunatus kandeliicorticis]